MWTTSDKHATIVSLKYRRTATWTGPSNTQPRPRSIALRGHFLYTVLFQDKKRKIFIWIVMFYTQHCLTIFIPVVMFNTRTVLCGRSTSTLVCFITGDLVMKFAKSCGPPKSMTTTDPYCRNAKIEGCEIDNGRAAAKIVVTQRRRQ